MLLNILLSYTGQFVPNCLQVNPLLDNLMKLHKSDCQYISLNLFFYDLPEWKYVAWLIRLFNFMNYFS